MSAGGAQGLEFGPFPQDIARMTRQARTRNTTALNADPDLVWNRKQRLVEGIYEVSSAIVAVRNDATPVGPTFKFIGTGAGVVPAEQQVQCSLEVYDMTAQSASTILPYIGDFEGADVDAPMGPAGNLHMLFMRGILRITTPLDLALGWGAEAASPLGVTLFDDSIMRLRLVR